ncbi:MAG: hypothetical protein NXI25_25325 [bacterium]|nr:hypothetical protein [bacterium]
MNATNDLLNDLQGRSEEEETKAPAKHKHNTHFPIVESEEIEFEELPGPEEQGITDLRLDANGNRYEFKSRSTKKGGDDDWYPISNFTLRCLYLLKDEHNPSRVLELTNVYGEQAMICLPTEDVSKKSKFEAACESEGNFVFNGTAQQHNRVKEYLYHYEKQAEAINTLGWQPETKCYAFADVIFDGKKVRKINKDGVVQVKDQLYYLPAFSQINKNALTEYRNERKNKFQPGHAIFREYAHQLVMVFGDNAKVGIAFFIAALFRDVIFSRANCFPMLFLFGPKGTGKTTFRQFLMRPFGDYGPSDTIGLGSASSPKGFSRKLAQLFNAVVPFEEYKNTINPALIEMLKNIYDGIGYERAQTSNDNKTHSTAVNSAVIVGGQEMPTKENALFSRMVLLKFAQTQFQDEEKEEFRILEEMMKDGLGNVLLEILQYRAVIEKEFAAAFDRNYKRLRMDADTSSLEERSLTNIASLLAPFDVLSRRIDMPFSMDGKEGLYSVLKDIAVEQQKQISGTNEVNEFWKIFDQLATDGEYLHNGFQYKIEDGYLYISFPSVYKRYNNVALEQNLNKLDKNTLRSYLTMDSSFAKELCEAGNRTEVRKRDEGGTTKRYMPFKIAGNPVLEQLDCLHPDNLKEKQNSKKQGSQGSQRSQNEQNTD